RYRAPHYEISTHCKRRAQAGRPSEGFLIMPADPVTLARDLLRCPSVTPAEAGALGVLEAVLKAAGFAVHRITFAEPGTAPVENLYARIGRTAPHLIFAGHTDVVPPGQEAKWSHPPFAGK